MCGGQDMASHGNKHVVVGQPAKAREEKLSLSTEDGLPNKGRIIGKEGLPVRPSICPLSLTKNAEKDDLKPELPYDC